MSEKGSAIDLSQYIIRVVTDDCRYRFALNPNQTYADLLECMSQKIGIPAKELKVFSQNGRKLNLAMNKKLKEVVYLRHGSILKVQLPRVEISHQERNSYIRSYSPGKSSLKEQRQNSKIKTVDRQLETKCNHPLNGKCLSCLPKDEQNKYVGNGLLTTNLVNTQQSIEKCECGPNMKCLKCMNRKSNNSPTQSRRFPIFGSPKKAVEHKNCEHSPNMKCFNCLDSPSKLKSLSQLKTQSSINSPIRTPTAKSPTKLARHCQHGDQGMCLNCLVAETEKDLQKQNKKCLHGQNAKCIHCLGKQNKKFAHISFDQYLYQKKEGCSRVHKQDSECPNCAPLRNPRLVLLPNCDQHTPYPRGLCNRCAPQNIALRRQPFRHVDYVQFMNGQQIQGFIRYWEQQKKMGQLRIGFLYGYYAEDPYYERGIRAVVQALFQPEQRCTSSKFQLRDQLRRTQNLQKIVKALGLEKVGMIIASPNRDYQFTQDQIRTIADFQETLAVLHRTGYKLSNFFTVLVRPTKDGTKVQPEPRIFMISDQGQALQSVGMFVPNPHNPRKMRIRTSQNQLLPSVYLDGQSKQQFQPEYLLVNIASGMAHNNKFAILKGNDFPSLSRGRIKKAIIRDYIRRHFRKPALAKYGDINLLLLIAQLLGIQTAQKLAKKVGEEEAVQAELDLEVQHALEALL